MEQKTVLPYMTEEEAATYRNYYGIAELPATVSNPNILQPPDPTLYGGSYKIPNFPSESAPAVHSTPPQQFQMQPQQLQSHHIQTQQTQQFQSNHLQLEQPQTQQFHSNPLQTQDLQSNHLQSQHLQIQPAYGETYQETLSTSNQDNSSNIDQSNNQIPTLNLPENVKISTIGEVNDAPLPPPPNPVLKNYSYWEKLTIHTRFASRGEKPSASRIILRAISFVPSLVALILISFTEKDLPSEFESVGRTTILYIYFPAILNLLLVLVFSFDYYQRRFSYRPKWPRWITLTLDSLLTLFWVCGVLPLAFQYQSCTIGGALGWCNLRNSLLAFSVMAGGISLLNTLWDLFGTCLSPKKI